METTATLLRQLCAAPAAADHRRSRLRDSLGRLFAALLIALLSPSAFADGDLVFSPAPSMGEPTARQLLDLERAGERLVAVGASGLVVLSDDGGDSWRQVEVPVSATLTAVHFPSARRGWAVGHAGVIIASDDGGETWTLQFDGRRANAALLAWATQQRETYEADLAAAEEAGADAAEIDDLAYLAEEAVYLQEDAQLAVDTGPADPFLGVYFLDEQRGMAVGAYGMVYRTENGGQDWRIHVSEIDNLDRFHLYALAQDAGGALYLSGEAGLLYRSTDEGVTFERFFDVYDGSLFGLLPYGEGMLVYGLRGNLFTTDATGSAWRRLDSGNRNSLYGGTRLDNGDLLLVGAGGRILSLGADGSAQLLQHPSRSTFSSALQGPDGRIWLVGMDGLARFDEAKEVGEND